MIEVIGLECLNCGKAVFYYSEIPNPEKAFFVSKVIPLPNKEKPKSYTSIICQYCNKDYMFAKKLAPINYLYIFNYETGEKIRKCEV